MPLRRVYGFIFVFLAIAFSSDGIEVSARVGGFRPDSKLFREIYGSFIPEYQLEASQRIFCNWKVWGNISYLCSSGHSKPLHNKTRLWICPVSLGLKYVCSLNPCWNVYSGGGIAYTWLHEKNSLKCCPVDNTKSAFGGIFKLGIERCFRCFKGGAFVDYRYQYMSGDNRRANLSGFSIGGDLGFVF